MSVAATLHARLLCDVTVAKPRSATRQDLFVRMSNIIIILKLCIRTRLLGTYTRDGHISLSLASKRGWYVLVVLIGDRGITIVCVLCKRTVYIGSGHSRAVAVFKHTHEIKTHTFSPLRPGYRTSVFIDRCSRGLVAGVLTVPTTMYIIRYSYI